MTYPTDSLFSEGIKYAFTINPSDDYQFFKSKHAEVRTGKCVAHTIHFLKEYLAPYASYQLQMEVSTPSNSCKIGTGPRIHWHGYVVFTSPIEFLLTDYSRLKEKFIFEVDTIDDKTDTWESYVNKNRSRFEPFCKKYRIPYTIDNTTSPVQADLLHKYRVNTKQPQTEIYKEMAILDKLKLTNSH